MRQRHVFTDYSNVARLWATQSLPDNWARCRSLSAKGIEAESYCTTVARIVKPGIAFITDVRYSHTTARHINGLASAARHNGLFVFYVPDLYQQPEQIIQHYQENIAETVTHFWRATWRCESHFNTYHCQVKNLLNFCRVFDLPTPTDYATIDRIGLTAEQRIQQAFWTTAENRRVYQPTWLLKLRQKIGDDSKLPAKVLLKIRNVELRRNIIHCIGIERVCFELGAKTIDIRGSYSLLMLDLGDGRQRPYLRMENPSCPEVWHLEGVHPACQTVQDALNYRRFGNDCIELYDDPTDTSTWRKRQLTRIISPHNWQPEKLT